MAHGACAAVGSGASAAGGTLLAALSDEAAATSHLTSGYGRPAVPERAVHAQLQAQGRAALSVPGGSAHVTTKQTPVVFLPLLVTVARIHTVYREVLPRHATALARGCVLRERTLLTDSAVGHQGQALVLGWIIGSLSPNPALLSGAGPPSVLHCFLCCTRSTRQRCHLCVGAQWKWHLYTSSFQCLLQDSSAAKTFLDVVLTFSDRGMN